MKRSDSFSVASFVSVAAFMAASIPLSAQDDGDEQIFTLDPFTVSSEGDVGYLSPNSVSATRTAISSVELPFSLRTLNQAFMEDTGSVDFNDNFRYVAGATAARQGPSQVSGRVNLRGFTTIDTKRNGFVVRGQGIYNNAYIERIEILKGPQSVLYGIGRPGGSINLITKKPLSIDRTDVTFKVGSYDYYQATVDTGGPLIEDTLNYRLVVDYTTSGSYINGVESERNFVGGGVEWFISDMTKLSVDFNINDYDYVDPALVPFAPDADGVRKEAPGLDRTFSALGNDHNFDSTYDETALWVTLTHKFNDTWAVRSAFEYLDIDQDRYRRQRSGLANLTAQTNRYRDELDSFYDRSTMLQTDLTGTFEIGDSITNEILIGTLFEDNTFSRVRWRGREIDQINDGGTPTDPSDDFVETVINGGTFNLNYLDPIGPVRVPSFFGTSEGVQESRDRVNDTIVFYAVDQISLMDDQLKLFVGLRKEETDEVRTKANVSVDPAVRLPDSDKTFEFEDYQLGFTYLFNPNTSVYASFSTSSRNNPNFVDDPEDGDGFDIGYKFNLNDGKLSGTLSLFDIELSNIENRDLDGNPALSGVIESRGAEIELLYQPTENLNIFAGYSYVDSEVLSDNRRPQNVGQPDRNVPENSLSFWGRYNFEEGTPLDGFGVGFGYKFTDSTRANNSTNTHDSYSTADVAFYYETEIGDRDLRLQLQVRNIFDEDTWVASEALAPTDVRLTAKIGW